MKRREFLKTTVAAAGVLLIGPGCATDDSEEIVDGSLFFPQSVASGDPHADSVILWTRVFDDARAAQNLLLDLQVGLDPDFSNLVSFEGEDRLQESALAAHDHCAKIRVTGLLAGTTYYYRFLYAMGGKSYASPTGRTRTAPAADAVCCNADAPLPFVRDLFAMVVLMDAFPYIWHKRLCADELSRVARPDGVVLLPHLHSSLGENASAGDPLSPAAYHELFAAHRPRLFSDRRLFDSLVDDDVVDLASDLSPDALDDEPSLTLVASRDDSLFRRHEAPDPPQPAEGVIVNPLYTMVARNGRSVLTLQFPTPEYAEEFEDCRRYLPTEVTIDADLTSRLDPTLIGPRYDDLRRRRILIDAPPRYC